MYFLKNLCCTTCDCSRGVAVAAAAAPRMLFSKEFDALESFSFSFSHQFSKGDRHWQLSEPTPAPTALAASAVVGDEWFLIKGSRMFSFREERGTWKEEEETLRVPGPPRGRACAVGLPTGFIITGGDTWV